MTNPIGDVEKAEVILITGSNTTENHPVLSTYAKRAVKRNNAKIIVVDPRQIPITKLAHKWLRQNLGTDVAWINGLMHVIIKENLYDKDYVANRTEGFEDLKAAVEKFTPQYTEEITGIPAKDIEETARIFAKAKSASICYAMGITQHICGTDNVKSLANLSMLTGNLGIQGGGVNPLRGQNNVQGACDMGGLPNVFPAYQPVTNPDVKARLEKEWGVSGMSGNLGLPVTVMLPMAHDGVFKSLYIIGENPLVSDPDLNHAEKCLEHLEFLVVQDIFMTETAAKADVVLPSACFAEKDGTFSNTERKVQRVRKAVDAPGDCKQDWEITCEIASRMGYEMKYDNPEQIFDEIARVTPSYGGLSYKRIDKDGLHWPCPAPDHPGTPILHKGQFTRGKGLFHGIDFIPPAEQPDEEYPLYLTTGRVIYHYHTGTMTMKSEGLNAAAPECFVEVSPEDAASYGIKDGDKVHIASRRGEITAVARVIDMTGPGTVFLPFHYAEAAANKLTNAALDPVAKIPEFKVCAVKIAKAA
ncbi:formate dehydrogenase major subunit [Desulfatibacillum alkenivorans DSM 16219]|jgi:formate dehydrogenase alpha subunit|uniref:nitrate reductase (cytochrome) n=3 Tax=Desulfatibacillum alkenivorans TaxID=259354 RepID=A0A1M6LA03_9BACT|nr:formate dehydrogenase major subunit [Desulfatibacillum alkenivorans DSM 16219]